MPDGMQDGTVKQATGEELRPGDPGHEATDDQDIGEEGREARARRLDRNPND